MKSLLLTFMIFLSSSAFATQADADLFNSLESLVGSEFLGRESILFAADVKCSRVGQDKFVFFKCEVQSDLDEVESMSLRFDSSEDERAEILFDALRLKIAEVKAEKFRDEKKYSAKSIRCTQKQENELKLPAAIRTNCTLSF